MTYDLDVLNQGLHKLLIIKKVYITIDSTATISDIIGSFEITDQLYPIGYTIRSICCRFI